MRQLIQLDKTPFLAFTKSSHARPGSLVAALVTSLACVSETGCSGDKPDPGLGPSAYATKGSAIIVPFDADLDLSTQLAAGTMEVMPPLVALGPRIVAGEGASPQNHTVVRVLDAHGIAELQFLAYPPSVTGGVDVAACRLDSGVSAIATAPLSDLETTEIRVFDERGLLLAAVSPKDVTPPYAIAAGDFVPAQPGDELAVTSQSGASSKLLLLRPDGAQIASLALPSVHLGKPVTLAPAHRPDGDALIVSSTEHAEISILAPGSASFRAEHLDGKPKGGAVFEPVFPGDAYTSGSRDLETSTLYVAPEGSHVMSAVDVGERENTFWVETEPDEPVWLSDHVRSADHHHIRTDESSPGYKSASFDDPSYDAWAGGAFTSSTIPNALRNYEQRDGFWEPCFTFLHHQDQSGKWMDAKDPATNLPRFAMLSRDKGPFQTQKPDGTVFNNISLAPDEPTLDRLYLYPLRELLRRFAVRFRGDGGHPERLIGLSPTLQMEQPIFPSMVSIGDYNPSMLKGFQRYLLLRYGSIEEINKRFGTMFASDKDIDPPRNKTAAPWDNYATSNPYFVAWLRFNMDAASRRLLQAAREALLAGFPPEAIKSHQTPFDLAYPTKADASAISPSTWQLASGLGFGVFSLGIFPPDKDGWLGAASSSGQTMITVGGYAPLTSDIQAATTQAQAMFERGVSYINPVEMAGFDTVSRAAYGALHDGGAIRRGTAGGVGAIRAVVETRSGKPYRYAVAALGVGPARQGLLKSLTQTGRWEGTVYVAPFHAHVEITSITEAKSLNLGDASFTSPKFEGLDAGDQLELTFRGESGSGKIAIGVFHDNVELPDQGRTFDVSEDADYRRYVLRFSSATEPVHLVLRSAKPGQHITLKDVELTLHRELRARPEVGVTNGIPHTGGVTFDLLSPPLRPH